ncbi:CsbD family protein [Pseudomonas mandelii]|nr:CsbD family protein [Pseudomonas sp. ANT_H12B]MSU94332.1 CsbD family protein [Pseudomonas mandelii]TBN34223.1 CsbD family protein [Pseudomonas sp. BGI-2]TWS09812.1 CsbD family protein [Pseudomonas mandelii]
MCEREQGLKEQQAAQCKGAAGAVHGNRLTSEGRADPSRGSNKRAL